MDALAYSSGAATALSEVNGTAIDRHIEALKNKELSAEQAGEEFEGLVLGFLLNTMFSTVEVNPLTGGGSAEETYRGLLIEEYGKAVTASGGLGIAEQVTRQLMQLQVVE